MFPSSQQLGSHSLGSLQCVQLSLVLGSPDLDTVASPGLSRGEWNDDLELLAAVLLTQPRDERWSARAEAEELCRASAAPHQRFPAPRCPQVRSGCCPAVGPSAALCGLQRPAAPVGPGSAIPLLSVLWWPDPEVPIGLPVPGEAADSLAVGLHCAMCCGKTGRGILRGVWHEAQEGGDGPWWWPSAGCSPYRRCSCRGQHELCWPVGRDRRDMTPPYRSPPTARVPPASCWQLPPD